ncbi:MAG TPA: pro-sigmaK processing inhibitor BofA family protein [Methanocella sp.]|nr:pro-sigmaK processing inhibitor BofA family protein [Methanocella sp.]
MDWTILVAVVVAAIVIFIAYKLLKLTLKIAVWLIVNAIGGLLILLMVNIVFSMGIPFDLPTVLLCAIGGIPGAICVVVLALLGTYM